MLDFLGIGAQKSGTTWLYRNLVKHPELCFPIGKEVHFWDRQLDLGVAWYASQFPDQPGKRNGEITPAYAILGEDRIRMVHKLNPQMRLIYILRDPRERAWSAALMAISRNNLDFDKTDDAWFLKSFRSEASQSRGDYVSTIQNWRRAFTGDQLLLVKFAEIASRPHEVMQTVARHLSVDAEFYLPERGNVIVEKVFAGPQYAIRPELKAALAEIYRDQICNLNRLLGETWFDEDTQHWAKAA